MAAPRLALDSPQTHGRAGSAKVKPKVKMGRELPIHTTSEPAPRRDVPQRTRSKHGIRLGLCIYHRKPAANKRSSMGKGIPNLPHAKAHFRCRALHLDRPKAMLRVGTTQPDYSVQRPTVLAEIKFDGELRLMLNGRPVVFIKNFCAKKHVDVARQRGAGNARENTNASDSKEKTDDRDDRLPGTHGGRPYWLIESAMAISRCAWE